MLHQDVANAVYTHIPVLQFHDKNTPKGVSNEYSTFVTGVFLCHNRACSEPSWRSGKVSIVIRRYQDGSYNAEVFNQRCKACNKLGILDLDQQTYIERVAYRLLKWAEVAVERPRYDSKETPPHRADLCEGCKRGICRDVGF